MKKLFNSSFKKKLKLKNKLFFNYFFKYSLYIKMYYFEKNVVLFLIIFGGAGKWGRNATGELQKVYQQLEC